MREWLVALLRSWPLSGWGGLDPAQFAERAPELCELVVRALGDDELALARLGESGEGSAGMRVRGLCGGASAAELSALVEALRRTVWQTARASRAAAGTAELADLAERLAHVAEMLRQGALPGRAETGEPEGPHPVDEWRSRLSAELGNPGDGERTLLLLEVDDRERIHAADPDGAESAGRALLAAVRQECGARCVVAEESPGRVWALVAGGSDRAQRLAQAAATAAAASGVAFGLSAGVAVAGRDGDELEGLLEVAEEQRLAAASRGIVVGDLRPARVD